MEYTRSPYVLSLPVSSHRDGAFTSKSYVLHLVCDQGHI